jgi:predicted nucleic acid-binding protein
MRYLIDTDWAVWWLRGRPEVVERLRDLRSEGLAISAVTLGEFTHGRASIVRSDAARSRAAGVSATCHGAAVW